MYVIGTLNVVTSYAWKDKHSIFIHAMYLSHDVVMSETVGIWVTDTFSLSGALATPWIVMVEVTKINYITMFI